MNNTSESFTFDPQLLQSNMEKINALTQRLLATFAENPIELSSPTGSKQDLHQRLYGQVFNEYMSDMFNNPVKIVQQQVVFWQDAIENWGQFMSEAIETGQVYSISRDPSTPLNAAKQQNQSTHPHDKRFKSTLWQDHPIFSQLSSAYLSSAKTMKQVISNAKWDDPAAKRRAEFFAQQYISLMSPSNFLPTNPDALNLAVRTHGDSLVRGLENLVRDVEDNKGRYGVALADNSAFELGVNVATTPGHVVFENELFQLIQYSPTTETVQATPLLIIPPWINKYYILDLQPDNSFIKFAVDRGLTVFIVSWLNPSEQSGEISFDDYMIKGTLPAINQARQITQQPQINTIGYCIGGTLMTCTLAWLAQNELNPVNSNTFFTTLTDFEDPGELGVFIEEPMIASMEEMAAKTGVLDSYYMGQIFSYLRPDNLVYGPAVKSYLMGKRPPAFDLLYWNGDSPNLPGKMVSEYLRGLYMDNKLVKGAFEFAGETIDMSAITLPIYAVATETDHIAPWRASFKGLSQLGSDSARFILAGSGHIAGVINAANSGKYGYKTNEGKMTDLDSWLNTSTQHNGSWWTDWHNWISKQSGGQVPARPCGGPDHPIIEAAPGRYVKIRH